MQNDCELTSCSDLDDSEHINNSSSLSPLPAARSFAKEHSHDNEQARVAVRNELEAVLSEKARQFMQSTGRATIPHGQVRLQMKQLLKWMDKDSGGLIAESEWEEYSRNAVGQDEEDATTLNELDSNLQAVIRELCKGYSSNKEVPPAF
jgi:hypothetical protein